MPLVTTRRQPRTTRCVSVHKVVDCVHNQTLIVAIEYDRANSFETYASAHCATQGTSPMSKLRPATRYRTTQQPKEPWSMQDVM